MSAADWVLVCFSVLFFLDIVISLPGYLRKNREFDREILDELKQFSFKLDCLAGNILQLQAAVARSIAEQAVAAERNGPANQDVVEVIGELGRRLDKLEQVNLKQG